MSPFGDDGPSWKRWLLVLGGIIAAGVLASLLFQPQVGEQLNYSQFLDEVEAGNVASVTIGPDGRVDGELEDGTTFQTVIPTAVQNDQLTEQLRDNDVEVEATPPTQGMWNLILSLAPFLLLIGLFWWFSRRARGQLSQIQGIGQSQAQIIDTERPDTRFDDVAGYEGVKEEVREVIDYLRDPSEYEAAGARGPGGILMVGPPGTGKTLIARAVAGEAEVPFISVAGSSFVEMLVGVGASRVRDLFEQARKRSPAIIFIDELDSVGRRRGGSQTIGANNEQEQTLNQLLAEMDGFDPTEGVVVIAATNRPQLLDPALLRPGRFDREIEVPLPLLDDRQAIVEVHANDKDLAGDVDLRRVARGTAGFSGADLENLVNEAAINAVRDGRSTLEQRDFEQARDRIMLGRRKDSNVLREEEKERVAIHEAGHAVVAAVTEGADPVTKITILPTRRALGATEQLPVDERRLHVESYLSGRLAVSLGGRVAERMLLGELSTGSAQDLAQATDLASRMVRDFGLSPKLGPIGYMSQNGEQQQLPPGMQNRPYAEETQRQIDQEVARLVSEAEDTATSRLEAHRDGLEDLVELLLEKETVDGTEVYEVLGLPQPDRGEGQDGADDDEDGD